MTNKYYEFFCPVKVIAGKAALEHIPYELTGLAAKRPMIVTDKGGVRAAGLLEPVIAACEESGLEIVSIYDDVPPDSSTSVVKDIASVYRKEKCDSIIAVGGGSAIDTGKAVNILVSEGAIISPNTVAPVFSSTRSSRSLLCPPRRVPVPR